MSPWQSLIKEAFEEGSLPEDLVVKHTKAAGVISYFYQTKAGWLQPEVEFIYDMQVPPSERVTLRPGDTEVETFKVNGINYLLLYLHCNLVLVDGPPRSSRALARGGVQAKLCCG